MKDLKAKEINPCYVLLFYGAFVLFLIYLNESMYPSTRITKVFRIIISTILFISMFILHKIMSRLNNFFSNSKITPFILLFIGFAICLHKFKVPYIVNCFLTNVIFDIYAGLFIGVFLYYLKKSKKVISSGNKS